MAARLPTLVEAPLIASQAGRGHAEEAQAKALFETLESLAEAASVHLRQGEPAEAIRLLQAACDEVGARLVWGLGGNRLHGRAAPALHRALAGFGSGRERAQRHLPEEHPVRQRAEQALREWQVRLGRVPSASSVRDSQFSKASRSQHGSRSAPGIGLPKHERMYLGLPPAVDLKEHRRRRRPWSSTSGMSMTSGASFDDAEGLVYEEDSRESHSAPGSGLNAGAHGVSCESRGSTSSSFWGHHSVKCGDLYASSSAPASEFPRTPNWSARRRVPGSFNMAGSGGRASWALRHAEPVQRVHDQGKPGKPNPFEDWISNGGSDKIDLKKQIIQSEAGIRHFHKKLKHESLQFKSVFLRSEIGADELYEDRMLYCDEGVKILTKSGHRDMPPCIVSREAKDLFRFYDVRCPKRDTKHSAALSSYGALLQASEGIMAKKLPSRRNAFRAKTEEKREERLSVLAGFTSTFNDDGSIKLAC
ncbi:unnamed protein product [Polarella glacialis]|uniref:Uncharacterized protein n=1 Tax=Polarella glacialis TaxID=89957 RepID=A0A813L3Q5_POLGL|nr:unnamed protein product [Polarella glacialis]